MAVLNFKGKSFVQNHHLLVKYHQLISRKDDSLTDTSPAHGSLIISRDEPTALMTAQATYCDTTKRIYRNSTYNTADWSWSHN